MAPSPHLILYLVEMIVVTRECVQFKGCVGEGQCKLVRF